MNVSAFIYFDLIATACQHKNGATFEKRGKTLIFSAATLFFSRNEGLLWHAGKHDETIHH